MKKLLIALMMLCLLPCACAEELSVHILDLSDGTLLTESRADVPEDFLRLCPEAGDAVRRITPEHTFLQHGMSSTEVYAAPDGSAWVMKGDRVFRLTDPGSRLTSLYPFTLRFVTYWQSDKALLYTQQRGGETDLRCIDLQTGGITPLLSAEGTLVLLESNPYLTYSGYTPLPGYSDLLLCTAQLTQADSADPALGYALEKVVGDLTWADEAYTAHLRADGHAAVEYGGERTDSLEAFAAAYLEMYPGHNLSDPAGSICERTFLTGEPAYGRLYEIAFNGKVFLWRDGEAHEISASFSPDYYITGLGEAVLTDLNADGTEELVCIFYAGSGAFHDIAAVYDPVNRRGMALHTQDCTSEEDEIHLLLEDGVCLLYQERGVIGTVTAQGLDTPSLDLTDLRQLLGF